MGPTRKSRSVNKRFSYINEISPSKDGENANKKIQRKRKLSDMLGPEWRKEELERFYAGYRKHGKDWKKVATVVRNRSLEMVEALYAMNRAYLSLPEGTASVAGLIAMMTDHYYNLAGTDSEQESNDGAETARKPQNGAQGKVQSNKSKGSGGLSISHSQAVGSSYGCLSLLKKKRSGGSRPRAVGKRTPRFPVSYSYGNVNREKYFSPSRQGLKLKVNANDDEVAHEIALALAAASQRGGPPQVSQTPNRRTCVMLSPIRNAERMHAELEMTDAKLVGSDMDEDGLEGSMEADNGDISKDKSYLIGTGGVSTSVQKGRRPYKKKLEVDDSGNNHLDDIREACSGTEEQKLGAVRGNFDIEVTDEEISRSSSQGASKRSKKVLFRRDEGSAFDALQTLANLSLMMPATANENEPSMQVKEENDDHVNESGLLEAMPANRPKEKRKSSGVKVKGTQSISRFEVSKVKTSKHGKLPVLDDSAIADAKEESHQSVTKVSRKKQKISASKIPKAEAKGDAHMGESQEAEAKDAGKKMVCKGRRSSQSASPKLVKLPECSSSTDPRREGSESALSSVQVPAAYQVNLPSKVRSRRKMELEKPQILKDLKFSNETVRDQPSVPFPSLHYRTLNLKDKLSNCLLNRQLRRWCTFEWFYSAIDYPWFAKREFVEYLYHVGLGHVPRLTHVEWGVIRSSLGKPRRFSEQFLKEEKEKLYQYRDSVRTHYTELRSGTREGLPTDLARPLSVGQHVIAIHPTTREIHDGSVLTVDHNRCRVQFDRPELGVEFVMDIDCMPLNPLENIPALLTRHSVAGDKFFENLAELKMNGRAKDQRLEGYMKFSPGERLENVDGPFNVSPALTYPMCNLLKQAKVAPTISDSQAKIELKETAANQQTVYSQPCTVAQIQAKEADVQALAELTRALDKKEALVFELRQMNDDVLENQKDGDCTLKDSEPFKKQYAAVLVQLNETNEQVSSALYCLRQRNTYQGNFSSTWPRPMANLGDSGVFLISSDHSESQAEESGSHANEIVESSKTKAYAMVDAAMQAMASLKDGENTIDNIEEAIDYVNDRLPLDDSCIAAMRPSTTSYPDHGSLASQEQLTSRTFFSLPASEMKNASDRNEASIPSGLITHCVATLLMIQKCTERQFPPAEVARVLDSAVTSLQPCCSQNLPVYAEIQKCMGMIRNQILALIPT